MFRQLKGRALKEAVARQQQELTASLERRLQDEQTNDLNGFPKYLPEHDQKFPLTGPCSNYDRDE